MKPTQLLTRAALALLMSTMAWAADATGKWTGNAPGRDGDEIQIAFSLKQDGSKLTGSAEGPGGVQMQIAEGKVEGEKLAFTVTFDGGGGSMKILHEGSYSGDEMKLTFTMVGRDGGPGTITLKRAK